MRASKEHPSTLDAASNRCRSILVVGKEAGKIPGENDSCLSKNTVPTGSRCGECSRLSESPKSSCFPDYTKTPGYGSFRSGRQNDQFNSPVVNETAESHRYVAGRPKQAVKDLASKARYSVYEGSCSEQKQGLCKTTLKEKCKMAAETYSSKPDIISSGRRVILPPIEASSQTQTQTLHVSPTKKPNNRTEKYFSYHYLRESFGSDGQGQKKLSKDVIETALAKGPLYPTDKDKIHKPEYFCQSDSEDFADTHHLFGIEQEQTLRETEYVATRRSRVIPARRRRNNISAEQGSCFGQQIFSEADAKVEEPRTTRANQLFVPFANRQYRTVSRAACFGRQEFNEDDIKLAGRRKKVREVQEERLSQRNIVPADKRQNKNTEIMSCTGRHEHLDAKLKRTRRWGVHVEMGAFNRQEVFETSGNVRDETETSLPRGRLLAPGGRPQNIAISTTGHGLSGYSSRREFSQPERQVGSRREVKAMQDLRRQNMADEHPPSRARAQQEFSEVERQPRKRQGVCQETDTFSAERMFLRVLNKRF